MIGIYIRDKYQINIQHKRQQIKKDSDERDWIWNVWVEISIARKCECIDE